MPPAVFKRKISLPWFNLTLPTHKLTKNGVLSVTGSDVTIAFLKAP